VLSNRFVAASDDTSTRFHDSKYAVVSKNAEFTRTTSTWIPTDLTRKHFGLPPIAEASSSSSLSRKIGNDDDKSENNRVLPSLAEFHSILGRKSTTEVEFVSSEDSDDGGGSTSNFGHRDDSFSSSSFSSSNSSAEETRKQSKNSKRKRKQKKKHHKKKRRRRSSSS